MDNCSENVISTLWMIKISSRVNGNRSLNKLLEISASFLEEETDKHEIRNKFDKLEQHLIHV
jgi:hypothetical protein